MKKTIIIFVIIAIVGFSLYFLIPGTPTTINNSSDNQNQTEIISNNNPPQTQDSQSVVTDDRSDKSKTVIGQSVEKRDIIAYHYGNGEKEILFVGGIHGGYEWNTSLLAYEAMDYLENHPEIIPEDIKVTIIPVLNPDGLYKITKTSTRFSTADISSSEETLITGRFNANKVDLNRNFDCDWNETGVWQNKTVSGGSTIFSEPESRAIRDYIEKQNPQAVIVWYSAAGGVYSSSCHNGILPETKNLTKIYAQASGYTGHKEFDSYAITGDMVNWLAKEKIPAISVLLSTHNETEWEKNKAGIEAILNYYKK